MPSVAELWRWQLRRDASRIEAGIVTLMFTDLVSSSELIEALGDDASNQITRAHFRLLREIVAAHNGHQVKNLGDGLMIVFPSALGALSCAIAMQRAVRVKNKALRADLEIRIGLHTGEPVRNKNDYFGRPVVIAKRLCDSAEAGQIVASSVVENIVGSRRGVKFIDLGLVAMKGLSLPVEAREVIWGDDDESSSEPFAEPAARPSSRKLPRVVGVAAVAAVGAIAILILTDQSLSGIVSKLSGGNADANPRVSRDSPIAPARAEWAHIDGADLQELGGIGHQAINRIATDGKVLVAVGSEEFSSGELDGAVWVSKDPENWHRVGTPAVFGGPGHQVMWGVAIRNGVIVAVGYEGAARDADAAVWISEGGPWRRVEDQPELGGSGLQVMNRVAAYPRGFIAVGFDSSGGDQDAAVWISPDGSTWTRVRPSDDDVFGGVAHQKMFGVDVGPELIVAVGEDRSRSALPAGVDGVVWESTNGIDWVRVPRENFNFKRPDDQTIRVVQSVKRGFVAVGSDEGVGIKTDAAVWRSDDGRYWERIPYNEEQLGGLRTQVMLSLTLAGDVLYAGGYDKLGGGRDAAVWTSKDSGNSWTREPPNEEVFGGDREQVMKSLVVFGSWVVAGGWGRAGNGQDAQIWYTPLAEI